MNTRILYLTAGSRQPASAADAHHVLRHVGTLHIIDSTESGGKVLRYPVPKWLLFLDECGEVIVLLAWFFFFFAKVTLGSS